jgi:large subunit ribosomal protein L31
MKAKIHPEYNNDCMVTCACGKTFTTGSTMKEIRVELCNQCHPFYTGEQRFVDSASRIQKFKDKRHKERQSKMEVDEEKLENDDYDSLGEDEIIDDEDDFEVDDEDDFDDDE